MNIPDAPWIRNAECPPADYPACPCCGSEDYDFIFYVESMDEYFCTDCCRKMDPDEFAESYDEI